MSLHAPHNPLESDDNFYNIIEHSHVAQNPVSQPEQMQSTELGKLTGLWKQGKISYHDYALKKYSLERMARTFPGKSSYRQRNY